MKTKKAPYIFIAPVITLGIMLILYALAGIFPFGTASTAFGDGIAQYTLFLSELANKIKEGGSLFFSWHIGFGANFWANIGYYIMSPLSLIALFFPPDRMQDAFSLITLIKPCFLALTFGIYLKTVHKKADFTTVAFSVLWAMSSFMVGSIMLTTWLDALVWFPLALAGLHRLMNGESGIMYALFLGLTIISNFYIGWITCIFCVIYFIYSFIADDEVVYEGVSAPAAEKQEDEDGVNIFAALGQSYILGSFLKFFGSSLVAGAFSAIFTLPIFNTLQNTDKGTTYSKSVLNVGLKSIPDLLASHIFPFKNTYVSLTTRDVIFVFAGILSVILCVAYFFAKGISLRKKLGNGFLLLAMWVSIAVYPIYFVWHGFGEPAGLIYRFAFVYAFIILKIAYEALENLEKIPIYGILAGTAFAAICAVCIKFANVLEHLASTGIIITAVVCIVLFTLLLLAFKIKPEKRKVLTLLLTVCVVGEAVAFNYDNLNTKEWRETFSEYGEIEKAVEKTEAYDNIFYDNGRQDYRDELMYGVLFNFNNQPYYSSMADGKFTNTIGMLGNYNNSMNAQNGGNEQNPVYNLAFPTKWYFDSKGNLTENEFRSVAEKTENLTVYKNNYTMPFMYSVSKDVIQWNPMQFLFPIDNLNEMAKEMTGVNENILIFNKPSNYKFENSEGITVAERWDGADDGTKGLYNYMADRQMYTPYSVKDIKKPAYITYDVTAEADGIMYIFIDTNELTDMEIEVNGRKYSYYLFGKDDRRTYELGEVKKGDVATVKIGGYRDNGLPDGALYVTDKNSFTSICYTVDMEKFKTAYNTLDAMSDTEMLEFKDNYVKAKVTANENGMLYIPTAYDTGWSIFIDGNEVPLYEHPSHILMAEITEGEHIVEMKYVPAGFTAGAVISGVAVLILIAWAVISKKAFKKAEKSDIIPSNDTNEE